MGQWHNRMEEMEKKPRKAKSASGAWNPQQAESYR
jgi:hypothetical protein